VSKFRIIFLKIISRLENLNLPAPHIHSDALAPIIRWGPGQRPSWP